MGFTTRPVIMGTHGVVTAGHYLAAAAGFRIMGQGGNAADAAAAMGFCLNLVEPQNNGLGGEAPTLVYSAKEKKTYAVSGMGWSPKAFTIPWCRAHGVDIIPGDGYLPACVPAAVDTWALLLARFGTMPFAQIAQPAIELAEKGFPVYEELRTALEKNRKKFLEHYPSSAKAYLKKGRVPEIGEIIRTPDWARTLRLMCRAEAAARKKGRRAGIGAARDVFYKGEIAEKIIGFINRHPVQDAGGHTSKGLLTFNDMAEWHAQVEEPVTYNYRGLEVHKCPAWTQGPVFLQQLAILQGYNLKKMGHNSVEYLHTWIECAKLAFADREAYYGDPLFDDTPFNVLLSKKYNDARRRLIGRRASPDMRPGDAGGGIPEYAVRSILYDNRLGLGLSTHRGDTTHLDAIDIQGNMVAATPSGGWIPSSPVIEGLGFPLGTRGQMFYLNPGRPNALEGRKRPRATLTPSLATRHGRPYLAFGTPGGDSQDQWTLQFFLNYVDFGMSIQEAIDAPLVYTDHFPSSFYPREAHPLRVHAEKRIPPAILKELERRGHKIERSDEWSHGRVLGIRYDEEKKIILGGASARGIISYALGW
jgi:gamma-glutamyltranspeptidase / glutathione hydrolase